MPNPSISSGTISTDPSGKLRAQEHLPLHEWAERNVYVTLGPAVGAGGTPVKWSNSVDPLGVDIMRAFSDSRWSSVVVMGSPQASGKTELIKNLVLETIKQRNESVFYHNASMMAAMDVWKKKIAPCIEKSPGLEDLLSMDREERGTKDRRDFTNGTSLFIRGSESRGALAQASACVTIADDVQAMSVFPEGDHPVDLGKERADSFPVDDRRHIIAGQPGMIDDYLSRALFSSAFFVPFVPCLSCGVYQMIEWTRMVYDDSSQKAARQRCVMRCVHPDCEHEINDTELVRMLARGKWISTPANTNWVTDGGPRCGVLIGGSGSAKLIDEDGVSTSEELAVYPETNRPTTDAGFWRSSLYWQYTQWGPLAGNAVDAEGNEEKTINFQKRVQAKPYKVPEVDEERVTEQEVREHIEEGYVAGTVPNWVDLVSCTVDVQSGYVYYIVRGWRKSDGETCLISLGTKGRPVQGKGPQSYQDRRIFQINESLGEVDAMIAGGYPFVSGGVANVKKGAIDRGFEGEVVGSWWRRRHRGVWQLIRGQQAGASGAMWPNKPTRDKKGIPYRLCDVNQAKHLVRKLMRIPKGSPGYWHVPSEGVAANTMKAYCRHLASEVFDRTRKIPAWAPVDKDGKPTTGSGAANHFWDCEVYQVCLAIGEGVKFSVAKDEVGNSDSEGVQGGGGVVTSWFGGSNRRAR